MAAVAPRWEAMMRHLSSLAICGAVLYGIDAIWFNGWYFAAINRAIMEIYVRW